MAFAVSGGMAAGTVATAAGATAVATVFTGGLALVAGDDTMLSGENFYFDDCTDFTL